jgi:hypothetical protein
MASWRESLRKGVKKFANALGVGSSASSNEEKEADAVAAVSRLAEDLEGAVDFAIDECRRLEPTALTRSSKVHDRVWAPFMAFDEKNKARGGNPLFHVGVRAAADVVLTSFSRLEVGTGCSAVALAIWLTECTMKLLAYINMRGFDDGEAIAGAASAGARLSACFSRGLCGELCTRHSTARPRREASPRFR